MVSSTLSRDGFLHAPDVLDAPHIAALLDQVNLGIVKYANSADMLYEADAPKKLLYAFNKGDIFLKTLVSEPILSLLLENSDDISTIVPTWEDVVIKQPHSKNSFNPHQDLPMQSLIGNTFSIALYLHDSCHNPVHFLPKSHHFGPLTRIQLDELCKNEMKNFVAVPAKAGDIVIHYAKTVHYSESNHSSEPRYTWYMEFRTLDQLYNDSPWNAEWILQRRAIFIYALEKYCPEKLSLLAPDYKRMKPYLKKINLRIAHVTDTVDFDMASPYYHF